eukprot:10282191-Alexandrium_andersonii.AAC.1
MDHVLRTMLPPYPTLWGTFLGRKVGAYVRGDNQACFQIAKSGANPTMRHLERTHRCNVQWIRERYVDGEFEMYKIETDAQAAGISHQAFQRREAMDRGSRPGSRSRHLKVSGMRRVWRGGFSLPARSSESKMPKG